MHFELTNPDNVQDEQGLERLRNELRLLAARLNVISVLNMEPGLITKNISYTIGLMRIRESYEQLGDRSTHVTQISVSTLLNRPKEFDLYDPALYTRRYTFDQNGPTTLSIPGTDLELGSLGQGLAHLLDHIRESLVQIRNETDEKIKAVMALERSITGKKPVETRLGDK